MEIRKSTNDNGANSGPNSQSRKMETHHRAASLLLLFALLCPAPAMSNERATGLNASSRILSIASKELRSFLRLYDFDRVARGGYDIDSAIERHTENLPLLFLAFRDRYGVEDDEELIAPSKTDSNSAAPSIGTGEPKKWWSASGTWETLGDRKARTALLKPLGTTKGPIAIHAKRRRQHRRQGASRNNHNQQDHTFTTEELLALPRHRRPAEWIRPVALRAVQRLVTLFESYGADADNSYDVVEGMSASKPAERLIARREHAERVVERVEADAVRGVKEDWEKDERVADALDALFLSMREAYQVKEHFLLQPPSDPSNPRTPKGQTQKILRVVAAPDSSSQGRTHWLSTFWKPYGSCCGAPETLKSAGAESKCHRRLRKSRCRCQFGVSPRDVGLNALHEADVLLFAGRVPESYHREDSFPPETDQKWVVVRHEPLSPDVFDGLKDPSKVRNGNVVDVEVSWRRKADVWMSYIKPGWRPAQRSTMIPFNERARAPVAAFISNCTGERMRLLAELMKHVEVHSYGDCMHNRDEFDALANRADIGGDGSVAELHPTVRKQRQRSNLRNKHEIMRNYKFVFAAENSRLEDYVTEKWYDAFEAGTVPIYIGAPNIADEGSPYLPSLSASVFVNVDDFKEPGRFQGGDSAGRVASQAKKLGAFINKVAANEKLWNAYSEWYPGEEGDSRETPSVVVEGGTGGYSPAFMDMRFADNMRTGPCNLCDALCDGAPHLSPSGKLSVGDIPEWTAKRSDEQFRLWGRQIELAARGGTEEGEKESAGEERSEL